MFFISYNIKTHRVQVLILLSLLVYVPSYAETNNTINSTYDSAPSTELNTITVFSNTSLNLLSPSVYTAENQLRRWPGNVGLINQSDYDQRAILSLGDALAREAGVFARSTSGQQSAKLSIRGSGLASPLGLRGVTLLRNGLPLNQADGTVDPSYANPFNAHYIEIYRGSNALKQGAATLGGAINLVSPTGYSHPGLEIRLQGGSYGYLHTQARAGEVFDNDMDAFASISRYQMNGSAQQSRQETSRFYGNLGFSPNSQSESRLHIDIADMNQEISSPLTLSQLQGSANLENPPPRWPDHRIRTRPHVRLASQYAVNYGQNDNVIIGAHYASTRFDLLGTVVPIDYKTQDYGISISGEINRQLAGKANQLTWGASLSQGKSNSQTYGPFTLPGGHLLDPSLQQYEDISTSAQTAQFYLENAYSISPSLSMVSALQGVTAKRHRKINMLRNPQGLDSYFKNVDYTKRYSSLNPKLGLLWQPISNTQFYGNISRSYEPPTALEFYNSSGTTSAQKATTFEVGSRGFERQVNWDIALFYSRIKDELLAIPKLGPFSEVIGYEGGNIPKTMRAGIELQLYGTISPKKFVGNIDWELSYSFNRFRHVNDASFGNNRLPIIPVHYGRVATTYQHPSGLYLSPNIEFASSTYADQANTLRAPGYGIINLTLGYTPSSGNYRIFLEGCNLADKRYAASTEFLTRASPNEAAFNPGLRRAVFAGAEILW